MLRKIPQSTRLVLCSDEGREAHNAPERLPLAELVEGTIRAIKTRRGRIAVVILQEGHPRCYDARCPHMGADLTKASVGGKGDVICPWHGYRYDGKSGAFLENPNETIMKGMRVAGRHFDPQLRPAYRLKEYAVEIKDGWIEVA